jgi:carboxyl-terminal processing protease
LLTIFSEKSTRNVEQILTRALKERSKGVIIDLRNNTGGLFESALEILNLFLPKGSPVASIKNRDKKIMGSWKANGKPLAAISSTPIIILVNNYTASASEILVGVLQEYRKQKNLFPVFVVGDETFGKGSIQEIIPLNNECALKLTTGLYYLAFDREIQGKGIEPDFLLEHKLSPSDTIKWVTSTYGKESSLKDSIKPQAPAAPSKTKKSEKEIPWKERKKLIISQDYYVQNAINLLNLYNLECTCSKELMDNPNKALAFLKENYVIDGVIECKDVQLN